MSYKQIILLSVETFSLGNSQLSHSFPMAVASPAIEAKSLLESETARNEQQCKASISDAINAIYYCLEQYVHRCEARNSPAKSTPGSHDTVSRKMKSPTLYYSHPCNLQCKKIK